jgi:hypothetical protein
MTPNVTRRLRLLASSRILEFLQTVAIHVWEYVTALVFVAGSDARLNELALRNEEISIKDTRSRYSSCETGSLK